jgi:hypothetical protein
MWATLQDQSFLLGAVLVILVHAIKSRPFDHLVGEQLDRVRYRDARALALCRLTAVVDISVP